MPARFDHVTFTATDFAASLRFYDAALAALGLVRLHELGDEEEDDPALEAAGFGPPDGAPVLWLVSGPFPTRAAHIALRADRREEVERFHAVALESGGSSRSAPRRWPIYRRGDFNALVADPDGNLVEAVSGE